ncbi:uncharacterized protein N7511_003924 [Penicillium nucicola]|uniref:uncharacterized protein n=1 Tax=Penicillium nucicola TaxID=1850975 RepID=UPI0025454A59|nr:uncharacterized protein N7511_003924 [Penicillium nucicola]KAJ5766308.1 hypothetical protein N7511_003924 [Penicillium nucicola]
MAPSSIDYNWVATELGRWERDIDEAEQLYTTLARLFEGTGRTFFAMTAHISFTIDGDDSMEATSQRVISAVRLAWLRIRYDHPTIASWVEYQAEKGRCRKIYETLSTNNCQQDTWLNETVCPVSTTQTSEEWCNSDPPVPRIPTLFLVYNNDRPSGQPKTFSLVLRSHHDIVDGIGSLLLINNLMRYASAAFDDPANFYVPAFGSEWKNLSPPFRVAASLPDQLTTEEEEILEQTKTQKKLCLKDVEIATVPYDVTKLVPGIHQRVSLTLTSDETQRLLGACKEIGASLTHVYHASAAVVLFSLQKKGPKERKVRYVNYSLINERGQCQDPYNSPSHAVSVYHSVSGQSLVIDSKIPAVGDLAPSLKDELSELRKVIEEVKNYYHGIRDNKGRINLVPSYWALGTPAYPAGPGIPPIPAANNIPSVSISSMGVIDKIIQEKYGAMQLYSPWVTGEELGNGLGLFLGTFRGRLELSIAYNDAWHTKDEALSFIERCNSLVLQLLGVGSNFV